MYAVIATGGKQYKVAPGDEFETELIQPQEDKGIVFTDVLLTSDGDTVKIGTPYLDKAAVHCEVLGTKKAKKIMVFKYKRRKSYSKKQGHRQRLTRLKVTDIKI